VIQLGANVPRTEIQPGLVTTVVPYTTCGQCPSCRTGRVNACRQNQTLGVQRDGALAEYICVPWQKLVWSQRLSLAEHALVEPLSVGFHAVDRGRITATDTQIDRLVYDLYGLSEDEVRIVEGGS